MKLPISQHMRRSSCVESATHFVMRSSIDRGSRIKVGSVTRLKSAPGRSCDMMWESMLPCSESMTVSSSLVVSSPPSYRRVSSIEEPRLPRNSGMHQHLFVLEDRFGRVGQKLGNDALVSDDLRCLETMGRCGIVGTGREREREREEKGQKFVKVRRTGPGSEVPTEDVLGAEGAGEGEL
jgi:hypothetical protein